MNKWLFAPLAAVLLSACTGTGQKDAQALTATENQAAIVGKGDRFIFRYV